MKSLLLLIFIVSFITSSFLFSQEHRSLEKSYPKFIPYVNAQNYTLKDFVKVDIKDLGSEQPARWLSVDPLADKYPGWSPYNYVENNPLKMVDPDGAGPWDIVQGFVDAVCKNVYGVDKSSLSEVESKGDYQLGGDIGTVASALFGISEIVTGSEGFLGSGALEIVSGGTLTPVAVGTATISATMVGHGAYVLNNSITNSFSGQSNSRQNSQTTETKQSKVEKTKTVEKVGDKFTKTTEVRPGKGPGQSRSEYVRYKNSNSKTIRTYKDSYDRGNRFQGRKPLRGGPEGRPQHEPL